VRLKDRRWFMARSSRAVFRQFEKAAGAR